MADQFVGEIRLFAGNFAPKGWALCNGQVLSISQNTALFSLLGTQYGGNGISNFALPNLQGSVPMNQGNGPGLTPHSVGETGGEAAVSLTSAVMPAHTHTATGSAALAATTSPANGLPAIPDANSRFTALYGTGSASGVEAAASLSTTGGGQPHNNLQPFLVVTFIIATTGIYPPRS